MTELMVRLLDSTVRLRGPRPLLERVSHLIPTVPANEGTADIDVDLTAGEDLAGILALLNRLALAHYRSYAVHAGVVAHAGSAVAFPAVSGAGKTTLTAACLRTGFDYVSDEALVVGWTDGLVRAYPKWLSLSPWSARAVGLDPPDEEERPYSHEELGADSAATALPLSHVVLIERREGAPVLTPVSRATGARALLEMSFNHYQDPVAAFRLAARLAREAQVWTLRTGSPLASAELLAERLR